MTSASEASAEQHEDYWAGVRRCSPLNRRGAPAVYLSMLRWYGGIPGGRSAEVGWDHSELRGTDSHLYDGCVTYLARVDSHPRVARHPSVGFDSCIGRTAGAGERWKLTIR